MLFENRPWLRTVLATGLAVVYPGAGHAFLREWLRGLGWFGLSFLTAYVAILSSDVSIEGLSGVEGAMALQRALPVEATLAILTVSALNVLDAYVVSRRQRTTVGTPTCPACGKELDEELDFCPWCTTRLEWEDATSR